MGLRANHAPTLVGVVIEKIEGKWKLNQNHPVERRRKVVQALQQRSDENALAVVAMMQAMIRAED